MCFAVATAKWRARTHGRCASRECRFEVFGVGVELEGLGVRVEAGLGCRRPRRLPVAARLPSCTHAQSQRQHQNGYCSCDPKQYLAIGALLVSCSVGTARRRYRNPCLEPYAFGIVSPMKTTCQWRNTPSRGIAPASNEDLGVEVMYSSSKTFLTRPSSTGQQGSWH